MIKPYCYQLILSGSKKSRKIDKKLIGGKASNFGNPVTLKNLPKIYVLKVKDKIVYVGYTSQSISSRFYGGLKAKGEGGYYGYQWRKYRKLDLFVFCFDHSLIPKREQKKPEEYIQAIEAEIVFSNKIEI